MNPILDDQNFDARLAKLAEQHEKRQAIFATGYWSQESIAQRYAINREQTENQPPINWNLLKTLHLQTDPTAQLNNIILNLTRIQALAGSNTSSQLVEHLVRESQYLIEWTIPTLTSDTDSPIAVELVVLQQQLTQWQLGLAERWQDSGEREAIATQAQNWCQRLRTKSLLQVS